MIISVGKYRGQINVYEFRNRSVNRRDPYMYENKRFGLYSGNILILPYSDIKVLLLLNSCLCHLHDIKHIFSTVRDTYSKDGLYFVYHKKILVKFISYQEVLNAGTNNAM